MSGDGWIDTKERKPPNHERVLLFAWIVFVGWWDGRAFRRDESKVLSGVSHWMPLPRSPKGKR